MFTIGLYILVIILISLTFIRLYVKQTFAICQNGQHLVGKVVIVTGANTGIGFEAAKNLAERGAKVIIGCRNEQRGVTARDKIITETGNSDVHYRNVDFASLKSVRKFADEILKTEKRLDILINNAGILESSLEKSEDGLLMAMQINHFGPFLLTSLLVPLLKSSAPSRIVNVSSSLYERGVIDFGNLNMENETEKTYDKFGVYSNSKLCNILTTVELADQLKGTGVTVNALHPGVIATQITNVDSIPFKIFFVFMRLFVRSRWEGAQTMIYLATAREMSEETGAYFIDCKKYKLTKTAQDRALGRKVWEVSEKLVKLRD